MEVVNERGWTENQYAGGEGVAVGREKRGGDGAMGQAGGRLHG
jgi:hypothetical protein